MSLPRYPEYKDSGVPWIGNVPAHWLPLKVKAFADFCGGGTPSRDNLAFWNGDIPWVSPKDMKSERITGAEECITPEGLSSSSSSMVDAGRLLMVVRSGILKHTIPVAINVVPVAMNQDMKALRFSEQLVTSDFFLRWVQGLNDVLLLAWAKQGATVESIEHTYLAETTVPLPPLAEQSAIAAFLDRETGKIDALIGEQEKLLTLLAEKRQATISHAVTRGLNPNAPMKDSSVPWLGEVPAHWSTGALTRIAERVVVGIAEAATHAYRDQGVAILRSTNIRAGRIRGEILYIAPEFAAERGSKLIGQGDLITVRTGNPGVTAVVPRELDQCQCFTMLITTLRAENSSSYYCYWMNSESAMRYFQLEGWGSAQLNISVPILKALPVAMPPPVEQEDIVRFLDVETAKIDKLVNGVSHALTLLKERRSALIAAAVTGKIDIRLAA